MATYMSIELELHINTVELTYEQLYIGSCSSLYLDLDSHFIILFQIIFCLFYKST